MATESEFPGNSQRARERRVVRTETTVVEKKAVDKKIPQIVTDGGAKRKKKPLGKRFTETFVGGDARGVWEFVVMDVLIPAARDMIVDAGQEALQRMIYGDSRGGTPRNSSRSSRLGHTSYERRYRSDRRDRDEPRAMSRRGRAMHDFGEVVLDSRAEALEVIDQMEILIDKYDAVTVAELYEMVGITAAFTDEKYGWTDVRGTTVGHRRDGYVLNLPRPEALD